MVEEILKKYPCAQRDNLIPILQEVQERQGYISKESVIQIGEYLNLPTSKIYGVTTFYNQFRFHPKGKYHIMVCRGTACHVKGSEGVLNALCKALKIGPGQTTADGLFSVEVVACIGACGLAPVVSINGEFYGGATSEKIQSLISKFKDEEVNAHEQ